MEAAVREYARATGGSVLRAYVEVETGKRTDRPDLVSPNPCSGGLQTVEGRAGQRQTGPAGQKQNVHFLSGLMEAGAALVAVDMPSANRLTLHIMAAVGEDEAKQISERSKAALAAYEARDGLPRSVSAGSVQAQGRGQCQSWRSADARNRR